MLICPDEIWLTPVEEKHWRVEFKGQTFNVYEMEDHYEVNLTNEQGELVYIHLSLTFVDCLETIKTHFG